MFKKILESAQRDCLISHVDHKENKGYSLIRELWEEQRRRRIDVESFMLRVLGCGVNEKCIVADRLVNIVQNVP